MIKDIVSGLHTHNLKAQAVLSGTIGKDSVGRVSRDGGRARAVSRDLSMSILNVRAYANKELCKQRRG